MCNLYTKKKGLFFLYRLFVKEICIKKSIVQANDKFSNTLSFVLLSKFNASTP